MGAAPPRHREGQRPVAKAELVVQNGRLRGMRRTLENPTTFIGKSDSCDIRLNVDGISPLHCLIVRTESDWLLRDLESVSGTLVNGKRVSDCLLRHGDVILVGPYHFQVHIHRERPRPTAVLPGVARSDAEHREAQAGLERAAQRVQVAAVAAQQVALNEWELRLKQREGTLEKQQTQLSTHLEEKRKRLIELHSQTQAARQALLQDRQEYERHVEEVTLDLSKTERELLAQKQQVQAERKRLFQLRRGLIRRFRRHWRAQKGELKKRAGELAEALAQLEQDHVHLEQQKAELTQNGLKFNSEVELGRRQLQVEWDRFHQEQKLVREFLEARMSDILDRETELVETETHLKKEHKKLTGQLGDLRFEATGLENRIRQARHTLGDLHQKIQRTRKNLEAQPGEPNRSHARKAYPIAPDGSRIYPIALPFPAAWRVETWLVPAAPLPVLRSRSDEPETNWRQRVQELQIDADQLADQRLALVEQWELLVQREDRWYQERQAIGSQMVAMLTALQRQAQGLLAREQELADASAKIQARHQGLLQFREYLVGWQGRLRAQEIELVSFKEGQEMALAEREQTLQQQLNAVMELSRHWVELRRGEVEAWQTKQETCDKASQEYYALNQERRNLLRKLEEERRALTSQAMTLEQYRQECVGRSSDAVRATRRLEQLQRRWAAEETTALRVSKREGNALQRELAQIHARNEEMSQKLKRLIRENQDLHREKTKWEQDRLRSDLTCIQLNKQIQSALAQRDRVQQRLTEMRHEVELLARQLIEDSPLTAGLPDQRSDSDMPIILPLDRAA